MWQFSLDHQVWGHFRNQIEAVLPWPSVLAVQDEVYWCWGPHSLPFFWPRGNRGHSRYLLLQEEHLLKSGSLGIAPGPARKRVVHSVFLKSFGTTQPRSHSAGIALCCLSTMFISQSELVGRRKVSGIFPECSLVHFFQLFCSAVILAHLCISSVLLSMDSQYIFWRNKRIILTVDRGQMAALPHHFHACGLGSMAKVIVWKDAKIPDP